MSCYGFEYSEYLTSCASNCVYRIDRFFDTYLQVIYKLFTSGK